MQRPESNATLKPNLSSQTPSLLLCFDFPANHISAVRLHHRAAVAEAQTRLAMSRAAGARVPVQAE